MENNLYLGIDASTQSLTGIVIDINSKDIFSASINFDERLPEYKTRSGVTTGNNNEVWSYPQMWVDALDILFDELSKSVDLSKVKAIGGAGQQHASVWLNSPDVFEKMSTAKKGELSKLLKPYLSKQEAPVWLDASTTQECAEIEEKLGSDYVLQTTGSVQTERFTGSQIRKVFKNNFQVYSQTKRIHLNSSFMCSVLCNRDSPIDYGDASGMNLLNLSTLDWDSKMLAETAPELLEKLPKLSASMKCVGNIGKYFQREYGFSPSAKVVVFTGDNPSSLVGIGASGGGNAVISLGTSDTFFCANKNCSAVAGSHIFGNPRGKFMNLACFRNGSLAREAMKDKLDVDWKFFDLSFENYTPTDSDNLILPYFVDEISPKISSNQITYIGENVANLSKIELLRLFIEGQFFNMKLHSDALKADVKNILLTGGASKSDALAQCIANVFNCNVYLSESSSNASAMGAAMTAGSLDYPIEQLEASFASKKISKIPQQSAVAFYKNKIKKFEQERAKFIK